MPPIAPSSMMAHPDGSIWWMYPWGAAYQLAGDECRRLCSADELGLPEGPIFRYKHDVQLYYDTARAAPVYLVSTYATRPEAVLLGAWDGAAFRPIEQRAATRVLRGDGFAFDRRRGVLVHVLGESDVSVERVTERRAAGGGVKVRELGVDGTWRDAEGSALPGLGRSRLFAGWDGRRGAVVVIDEDTQRTLAWDGARWTELAKFPTLAWEPCAFAQGEDGELVYVHAERSTDLRAHVWTLGADGWQRVAAEGLTSFSGAVAAPGGPCRVAAPWFGPGTIPTQWGEIRGGRLEPAGELLLPALGATNAGPPIVWGTAPQEGWRHAKAQTRPVCAVLEAGGPRPLPGPPGPTLGLVSAGGTLYSVRATGEVDGFDMSGETWSKCGAAGPPPRERGNLGADPRGRILVLGGEPPRGSAFLKDAWIFEGGQWRELEAKGARPALVEAAVAYHPGLAAWLVAGGRDNKHQASEKVWLCDEKKWTSAPATWDGEGGPRTIASLAWDPASGQMLAVADERLWVYAGEGAWRSLGRFSAAPRRVAYDERARAVLSYSEAEEWRAEVGARLDAGAGQESRRARAQEAAPAVEEEALPTEVWLRCQEGDSDKFWFAALAGSSWTARWGRRGGTVREKVSEAKSQAAARQAYEKQVRAKLAEGYEHAPEREAAARVAGRTAWDVRLGARGEDEFGGTPPGVDAGAWPCCADCHHPMMFVALLRSHGERLPLAAGAAVALFACNGDFSGGTCETWDADAGCNRALLLSEEQLAGPRLAAPPTGPAGEAPTSPMKARKIAYKARFEIDPVAEENAEGPEDTSKVGGYPAWIQGDDTPACEACGGPMSFVAQLDQRLDKALNFGGGAGYLFTCPHEAKFLWQK